MTPPATETVYQVSDLNRAYRSVMDSARHGGARIRDTDGTSFVLVPERATIDLEELCAAMANYVQLERIVAAGRSFDPAELGDWTWLRHFDLEDLEAFVHELRGEFIAATRERDARGLRDVIAAWRTTSDQLRDEARREVLLGAVDESTMVEVARPDTPA